MSHKCHPPGFFDAFASAVDFHRLVLPNHPYLSHATAEMHLVTEVTRCSRHLSVLPGHAAEADEQHCTHLLKSFAMVLIYMIA